LNHANEAVNVNKTNLKITKIDFCIVLGPCFHID